MLTFASRFVTYMQLDEMDCGPTCLKMILKYYGRRVSTTNIKDASRFSKSGVSLLGLTEAAEKYGFQAIGARLTFDELVEQVPLPCILHWDQHHFVVLVKSKSLKKILVADPAKGTMTYDKEEFLKFWMPSDRNAPDSKGIALLLTPQNGGDTENAIEHRVSWKMLFKYLKRYTNQVFQIMFGLFLASLLQLSLPYLTQSVVDTGIRRKDLNFIQIVLIAQLVVFFSQAIVEIIRSRLLLFVSTHTNLAILSDFWRKLMSLPLSFFDSKRTGDLFQRIADHRRIETFITGTSIMTLFSMISFLAFVVVLLLYSFEILIVFVLGSVVYLVWIYLFLRIRRTIDQKRFGLAAKENGITMQLIYGMHEIKLNNAATFMRSQWESIQASTFSLNFKSLSLNQLQQTGAIFINQGKNIFITYLVVKSVVTGELTLGVMVAIQYVIAQLNSPVEQLVTFSQQAQDAEMSLMRLNQIHQERSEDQELDQTMTFPNTESLTFKRVEFSYKGSDRKSLFVDLNIEFEKGKVTAIVGTSGSGKTTLIKLIQKFYDGYDGDIMIGDVSLRKINSYWWRSVTGSVMQDGYIFSDSIKSNIALGCVTIDMSRLMYACDIAQITSFIESLPLGLDTRIGDQGNGISSGQRQRILIARAVYKDPQYLFFDEATNALDSCTEKSIISNLQKFFIGKTVIVVAHRLSTVKFADKIVVLERGRVVEQGNHQSLLKSRGRYYDLVKDQLELNS